MQQIRHFPTSLGLALVLAALLATSVQAQEIPAEERSRPVTEPIEVSVDSYSDQLTRPESFEGIGNQLAQRLPEMADRMFQSIGRQTIQTLTDSGLSQADSEEIARRYAADFADCGRSAFMIEAERQSISINELLARFAEVTYIGNVDLSDGAGFDPIENVSKVMDFYSVSANMVSCVMGAMQNSGISFQSGLDALPGLAGIDSQ